MWPARINPNLAKPPDSGGFGISRKACSKTTRIWWFWLFFDTSTFLRSLLLAIHTQFQPAGTYVYTAMILIRNINFVRLSYCHTYGTSSPIVYGSERPAADALICESYIFSSPPRCAMQSKPPSVGVFQNHQSLVVWGFEWNILTYGSTIHIYFQNHQSLGGFGNEKKSSVEPGTTFRFQNHQILVVLERCKIRVNKPLKLGLYTCKL